MAGIRTELAALAGHLQNRRQAILDHWRQKVRQDDRLPSGDALSVRQLYDHLPDMLMKLEEELRGAVPATKAATQAQQLALAHGQERWSQGFGLREVVRELGTLNECVVAEMDRYATAEHDISPEALSEARRAWARMVGVAIEESLERYFELQKLEAASHLDELEMALESLRKMEQQRIDLWRQAAHDLRGNLNVVSNATAGLAHADKPEPVQAEFLRMLMRNVASLHHLLDDVTSLARLEAGHESSQLESVDVGAMLSSLCQDIRPIALERGLYLNCNGPHEFAAGADAVKVQRIAQNLILNAVKYTRKGGVTVSWSGGRTNDPPTWCLSVSDTGPGLGASTGNMVPQAARGEGIGLSIVKRLCELLNATVELKTDASVGTTFRITFPRGQ
jgi:signal transduction histidine kinase